MPYGNNTICNAAFYHCNASMLPLFRMICVNASTFSEPNWIKQNCMLRSPTSWHTFDSTRHNSMCLKPLYLYDFISHSRFLNTMSICENILKHNKAKKKKMKKTRKIEAFNIESFKGCVCMHAYMNQFDLWNNNQLNPNVYTYICVPFMFWNLNSKNLKTSTVLKFQNTWTFPIESNKSEAFVFMIFITSFHLNVPFAQKETCMPCSAFHEIQICALN